MGGLGLGAFVMVGYTWGFPKIRGTLLRALIIKIMVYQGLYGSPPILGN